MCRKKDIEIDGVLTDLELATKKAKVIIEDLTQDYFEESTIEKADARKIAGVYYEDARLMAQIVNDYLFEVLGEISSLQRLISGQEEEREDA